MSHVPTVSLMVITYNHERFVDDCLRAVAAQTFRDIEVIIVDDASSDGTVSRIEPWLDRLPFDTKLTVNERNLGICATRNLAVATARGTFLSSVSGDDFYEPDKIEREIRHFETLDDSVAAVFSNMRVVDEDGTPAGRWFSDGRPPAEGQVFDQLIQGNFIPAPTVMSRRAAVLGVGGYDETLFYEDYDMWLKLADHFEFRFLAGELVNYRLSASGASRSPAHAVDMHDSTARLLVKWYGRDQRTNKIARRRAWDSARRVFLVDRRRGRDLLRVAAGARPTLTQRSFLLFAAIPGADQLVRAVETMRRRGSGRRQS